jgi:transcriptional regulator with XRE-family HTH domain
MTMTDTAKDTNGSPRPLTPEEIGAVVRAVRVMQGWTQEVLAELSGLQTRTIQRVEQGQPSSIDTRRALARAFGLPDLNYFNALRSFPTDEELQRQKEAFERDCLLLDAQKVTGRQLLSQMQDGPGYGCLALMSVAELQPAAQDAFAAIADFTRDCMDIFDVASTREILRYGDTLDESISELAAAGFCLCAAQRQVKVTNKNWTDPTPMQWHITYLLAAPGNQPPAKVAVSRKVSLG